MAACDAATGKCVKQHDGGVQRDGGAGPKNTTHLLDAADKLGLLLGLVVSLCINAVAARANGFRPNLDFWLAAKSPSPPPPPHHRGGFEAA